MPAPIAPLIGFLLGVGLAWTSADPSARSAPTSPSGRSLLVVTLFSFLVFAPVSAYFLAFAPDWSYAYLIDGGRRSNGVDLAVVLLDVGSVPAGFALAVRRLHERGLTPLLRLSALPLAGVVVFLIVGLPRLSVSATYAQYHGDFGVHPVAGSPLGYALLWMNAVLTAGAIFTGWFLRQLSRKQRTR